MPRLKGGGRHEPNFRGKTGFARLGEGALAPSTPSFYGPAILFITLLFLELYMCRGICFTTVVGCSIPLNSATPVAVSISLTINQSLKCALLQNTLTDSQRSREQALR